MKSLRVLCTLVFLSLLVSSCTYKEDTAAFFITNQLNENLVLERNSEDLSPTVLNSTNIDISSSDSYEKYINRLREIDIQKIHFTFSDYQGSIENGKLFIDNVHLGDFEDGMDFLDITDSKKLYDLAELFLEKKTLEFTFEGNSNTFHYLSVDIEIEMLGTFVH